MTKNWVATQALMNTAQWDDSLITFYPEAKAWMSDPILYLDRLTKDCNYLNAAELLDWNSYLRQGSTVLDVGCGGGWLTAFLSKNPRITKLIAIDSSLNYLENFLPTVTQQMAGDISKIETVQGVFSPILLEAESVDLIVISSAIHHAESMGAVLAEFRRVLKPDSYLIILNETPVGNVQFMYQMTKAFIKIFFSTAAKRYSQFSQKISASGILYDPYLGDVDYPKWYWQKTITSSGFDISHIQDTKLGTVVNSKGRFLHHFVCKKTA